MPAKTMKRKRNYAKRTPKSARSRPSRRRGGAKDECESFCKDTYMPEINKNTDIIFEKIIKSTPGSKKYTPPKRTKADLAFQLEACKKMFCNDGCKGFNFQEGYAPKYHKDPDSSFVKSLSKRKIAALRAKGAKSTCLKELSPFSIINPTATKK